MLKKKMVGQEKIKISLLGCSKRMRPEMKKSQKKSPKNQKISKKIVKKLSEMRCARAFRDRGCDPELFIQELIF